jgi:hypothetical protein
LVGVLVAGGVVVATQPTFAGDKPPAAVKGSAQGMTIHIDPKTGAILREPAPGSVPLQLSPQLGNAVSTSHQGLVESPITAPGGGVQVDLQGRFQHPLVVTIDEHGKMKMHHLHETPGAPDHR